MISNNNSISSISLVVTSTSKEHDLTILDYVHFIVRKVHRLWCPKTSRSSNVLGVE